MHEGWVEQAALHASSTCAYFLSYHKSMMLPTRQLNAVPASPFPSLPVKALTGATSPYLWAVTAAVTRAYLP